MTTLSDIAAIQAERHGVTVEHAQATLTDIATRDRLDTSGDLDNADAASLIDETDVVFGPPLPVRSNAGLLILIAMSAAIVDIKTDADLDALTPQKYGELIGLAMALGAAYELHWGGYCTQEPTAQRQWLNVALTWARDAFLHFRTHARTRDERRNGR